MGERLKESFAEVDVQAIEGELEAVEVEDGWVLVTSKKEEEETKEEAAFASHVMLAESEFLGKSDAIEKTSQARKEAII